MMMMMSSTMRSLILALLTTTSTAAAKSFSAQSKAGRKLLSASRNLEYGNVDFVGQYSIKFQGCHHVQQWNSYADEEDDVRIKTKRLVRFRLCPSDQCSSDRSAGCSSKFGDYIVDMNTFVAYYLQELQDQKDALCEDAQENCQNQCGNADDCLESCYGELNLAFCLEEDLAEEYGFEVDQFLECAEANFDGRRLANNNGNAYYIGPYCAAQGGEIHLGLFTDDTCTTYAQNGESTFYNFMGYDLPFSDDSVVSANCLTCGRAGENDDEFETSESCEAVYQNSGKCETRMAIDYPNESSCDYIEGIKIIREDGVIRTSSVRKSKSAAVAIGVFMTLSVLLAGYVFYLRTKLSRAQINLAASTAPLS